MVNMLRSCDHYELRDTMYLELNASQWAATSLQEKIRRSWTWKKMREEDAFLAYVLSQEELTDTSKYTPLILISLC